MLRMRRRGCWDRTQHIPGWRRRAMWYENDTAVPALRTNDRTGLGNTLRNVSPSLSSAPIVLGKHWLSGCLVPSGCLLLLHTDFLFDSIPFLFSPALCLLCKHTHALRFDRLTRIHSEKQTEAHACDSHQARRLPSPRATDLKERWDKVAELLTCVTTHNLRAQLGYYRLCARMKPKV